MESLEAYSTPPIRIVKHLFNIISYKQTPIDHHFYNTIKNDPQKLSTININIHCQTMFCIYTDTSRYLISVNLPNVSAFIA